MAPIFIVSIYHTIFNTFTLHITKYCYSLKVKHSQQTKDEVPKIHKSNVQDSCLYWGVLRFSTSKKISNFQISAFMYAQNSWDLQLDWSCSGSVSILSQAELQKNTRIMDLWLTLYECTLHVPIVIFLLSGRGGGNSILSNKE